MAAKAKFEVKLINKRIIEITKTKAANKSTKTISKFKLNVTFTHPCYKTALFDVTPTTKVGELQQTIYNSELVKEVTTQYTTVLVKLYYNYMFLKEDDRTFESYNINSETYDRTINVVLELYSKDFRWEPCCPGLPSGRPRLKLTTKKGKY